MKYKLKNGKILKDGHTMFLEDVVKDLERKSYLEGQVKKSENVVNCKNIDTFNNPVDLEKEFTPEFFEEFMFDGEFRTMFDSMLRGGSPYAMIEHLCKSKKEISKSLEKMVINFGAPKI